MVASLAGRLKSLRVLVVDGVADSANGMADLLRLIGPETKVAYDVITALSTAESFKPDLILVDLRMPLTSGMDLAEEIQRKGLQPQPVLVAVSSYADAEAVAAAGFSYVLTMPIRIAELKEVLLTVKATRQASDDRR